MDKRELIDEILRFNPKVRREFLLDFKESELAEYLQQLKDQAVKSLREWVSTAEGD